ncbi:glycosyltransferase family 2 protein [Flavobacterium agrisoli]|uniref:Glycosyltransferase n=1 Tax=Flavobacterium agrisoli TaxID=2793066 RepID=A0A934PQ59_9FLAO|nr:glycosyltransferase [Flavobacterium agrisoli]MBK0371289.1 glycosyltransferase [Flavobacterium agrisoli]
MIPLISVILPAYNAEKYLAVAVDSILSQTFSNFELLIINDGSSDDTESIVKSFNDVRIKYIKNVLNLGLIASLNKGISLATGKYIARMDADDLSRPERFEKQVTFLENNPDYVICSSARTEFTDNSEIKHNSYLPIDDTSIRISAIFSTPFTHPSVMFKKSVFVDNDLQYSPNFKYAEDYELWVRFLSYGKGYNFSEVLIDYRNTPNSQTSVGGIDYQERKNTISKIQQSALKNIGLTLSPKDLDFLFMLSLSEYICKVDFEIYTISYIKDFFNLLQIHFEKLYPEEKSKVYSVLGKRYLKIIVFNKRKLTISEITRLTNFKLIAGAIKNLRNGKK